MKPIKLCIIIFSIIILSACTSEPGNIDKEEAINIPLAVEDAKTTALPSMPEEANIMEEEEIEISVINLDSEEAIKNYLIGEWITDKETLSDYALTSSDINCNMIIDEDLNINLFFYNRYTDETIGDYQGQISFDRLDENDDDELFDLISIDLGDANWPGGDYLFLHRTIYDGKRVMSLFPAGNGNGIFDLLADIDNFEYAPEEILFEKQTGEKSDERPVEEAEFYAVYWGTGKDGNSLWLDEVQWTPTEEYDPDALYPTRMTLYQDDFKMSTLYGIAKEQISHIFINPMYPGEVYFVETDKEGNIIDFEDAAFKEYIRIINEP
jgi:hypothetical protein